MARGAARQGQNSELANGMGYSLLSSAESNI